MLLERLADRTGDARRHVLKGGMHRAQQAPHAHLGSEQTQLILARTRKLQVVYAHDLKALRIDDLLVEDIARQQQLIGLQEGEANVGIARLEMHTGFVHMVHVLTPANHERRLARSLERERRDMGEDLARSDAEVVHNTKLIAVHIQNGQLEHLGEIVHGAPSSRRPESSGRRGYACAARRHRQHAGFSPLARA